MWEFRKNNTFGALAFSSYGAFWIALRVPALRRRDDSACQQGARGTGLFLLAWTIFTAYMLVASLRTTIMLTAVFAFLFATFLVLTIGNLAAPPNATVIHVGGWLGLVTALLAWYHSAAGVTNAPGAAPSCRSSPGRSEGAPLIPLAPSGGPVGIDRIRVARPGPLEVCSVTCWPAARRSSSPPVPAAQRDAPSVTS